MQRQGSIASIESLKERLDDQKRRQTNLLAAIETGGDIRSLTERLRNVETEIARIQRAIDNCPLKLEDTFEGLRQHVARAILRLRESFAANTNADFRRAKGALARHVGRLVLRPEVRDGRPVDKVTGKITVP